MLVQLLFLQCWFLDKLKIPRSILAQFQSRFISKRLGKIQIESTINIAWKNSRLNSRLTNSVTVFPNDCICYNLITLVIKEISISKLYLFLSTNANSHEEFGTVEQRINKLVIDSKLCLDLIVSNWNRKYSRDLASSVLPYFLNWIFT